MYSDKENVNILTSLLVAHGVRHAVVCPGSRNAPLAHNLNACDHIQCYPVTDERSAGFFALGLSQALQAPVAVCVTSGSALLNLAPAAAEAFYQHCPLVILSADRPEEQIDQLMGQTLPQPDALGRMVRLSVTLPEPKDAAQRSYCNRLVNEALIAMRRGEGGPTHINIPISEPLFQFSCADLPRERRISLHCPTLSPDAALLLKQAITQAQRPMLCLGYEAHCLTSNLPEADNLTVLSESANRRQWPLEEMLINIQENWQDYLPDLIVYIGGSFVSKRVKAFLKAAEDARIILVNADGLVADPSTRCTDVVQALSAEALQAVSDGAKQRTNHTFFQRWQQLAERVGTQATRHTPTFSSLLAVRQLLQDLPPQTMLHCGNSSAVRLALTCQPTHFFVNRGVNGIEGSLSAAAGFAAGQPEVPVFCLVGDLSFFYDQNALWNQNLNGNLRILLLNNGGGSIFRMLGGLEQSEARNRMVMAEHHTTAAGICKQNDIEHRSANDDNGLSEGIVWLKGKSQRPRVLEVITDSATDEQALKTYYRLFKQHR
ncbi:MAG: 2-succinyl-5-enolpyruvyl-6-hydroxy-3-cyclohexene-1-carboxylic-acid synthase [Prevotellaceae bacterium]|nr:2-succinyl-5-enolpyruvyl-6-hydroxy-3-cyclohexene-1-carboxylic-acid synthase [Prevotellaceae bacterium]